MNFYNKHILPRVLNFMMSGSGFIDQRKEIVSSANGEVLEIGFGSGLNLPYYKNISKLYALDPSFELWELAQERVSDVDFSVEHLNAGAESIPLDDNSLDCVVETWTLCSIPDPVSALKEVYRVLKPGGKFIFVDHGKSPNKFLSGAQSCLTPFSKKLAGGCHLNRNIEEIVRQAGFEIGKIEKFQSKRPLDFTYKGIAIKP